MPPKNMEFTRVSVRWLTYHELKQFMEDIDRGSQEHVDQVWSCTEKEWCGCKKEMIAKIPAGKLIQEKDTSG